MTEDVLEYGRRRTGTGSDGDQPFSFIRFEFAKNQPGNVFQKEDWLDFSPENGTWFYRLYERDTDNGKNMRRAVDRLFRMDQEKREEIYEAVKHDMEFMDKKAWEKGKFNLESDQLPEAAQKILRDFSGIFMMWSCVPPIFV